MAGMREIRERIASVSEIMKITNAMYLISSSNLKKAKKRLAKTICFGIIAILPIYKRKRRNGNMDQGTSTILMLVVLFALMYFLMIRS